MLVVSGYKGKQFWQVFCHVVLQLLEKESVYLHTVILHRIETARYSIRILLDDDNKQNFFSKSSAPTLRINGSLRFIRVKRQRILYIWNREMDDAAFLCQKYLSEDFWKPHLRHTNQD